MVRLKRRFVIPEEIRGEVKEKGGFERIIKELPRDEMRTVAKVMNTLSDPQRVKILYALKRQRMCVCMLRRVIGSSYPRCSYHLSKLKKGGLVHSKRLGNYFIYSLTPFGKSIVKHFKKYRPEVRT